MEKKSSFIPNSTQTPNDYFDLVMGFLTGNEWKVLCFAIRHILGFHDRLMTRTRPISLSTFENGYGEYKGCGLNRKTIIEALKELEKYRLLVPVGKATSKGQRWYLDEYPDLEGLENRFATNKENAKKTHVNADGIDADMGKEADGISAEVVYSVHQQVVYPVHQSQCTEYTDTGVASTPNNILLSNSPRKMRKPTLQDLVKPDLTASTPGNIIQAWLTGIKATSGAKAWGQYNIMIAQDMIEAGITPADVTAFLASPHWLNKTPKLATVAEQIGGWKASQKPATPVVEVRQLSAQGSWIQQQLAEEEAQRLGKKP